MRSDSPGMETLTSTGAIVVEDRSAAAPPERVRIRLDGLDVIIGMAARTTADDQLVADCELPFLRLGSRLQLERAAQQGVARRGRLDWVALEISDDTRVPRLRLGLGLDRALTCDQADAAPCAEDRLPDCQVACSPAEAPARARPLPSRRFLSRWLVPLALVAPSVVVGALVGAAVGAQGDAPRAPVTPAPAVLPLPLPPRVVVAPPLVCAEMLAAVGSAPSPADALAVPRVPRVPRAGRPVGTDGQPAAARPGKAWARRAAARSARLRSIKIARYLARARSALQRRRVKQARHLARLVLLLDARNAPAAAILGQRRSGG